MQMSVEDHLRTFRELHGEEAWRSEVRRLAIAGIRTGAKHEAFWRETTKDFDWLNWDELQRQATSERVTTDPEQMMAEMIRKQMPGIKTQAQYDAVVGALDGVRLVLNAILTGDEAQEATARQALEMTFQVAAKATDATNRLEETPEAAKSQASEAFKQPPAQFHEQAILDKLMGELETLGTQLALNAWYAQTKTERDRVVTQSLRNTLLDAIRAKKSSVS